MSIQLQNGQFIVYMGRKPETGENLFDKAV